MTTPAPSILSHYTSKIAETISDAAQKVSETISNATQGVSDLHTRLTYTTKTKTESKTVREWIDDFTEEEEMKRLAALPLSDIKCAPTDSADCKDIVAATCREILNTCHLPEDDLDAHKKVYHQKSLKYAADKNPKVKDLAGKAQTALNRAIKLIRKDETCDGGEHVCSDLAANLTLKEPNWLYKQFGAESECQIVFEGGDPANPSPVNCSQILIT